MTLSIQQQVNPADVDVMNAENVWRKMYRYKRKIKRKKPAFKVGDHVRISKAKKTFEKGYKSNYTREIFKVTRVYKKRLPEYKLHDLLGDEILGHFMEPELQAVDPDESQVYKVKKVLRKKGKDSLVTWEGFPDKFKSWIPSTMLKTYK